jgi:crossover junction endodeoxyribonuclease RuvC
VTPDAFVPSDCPWPVVLGIDPGTRALGYGAVVVAPEGPRLVVCGVVRAPAKDTVACRLGRIADELDALLQRLRPRVIALESAFAARNVQSAFRIGEARGVVLSTAARRAVDVAEYAPAVAKKAMIGNGNASKEQVAAMVATVLGLSVDLPDDASDALALALTHVHRMALAERLGGSLGARSNEAARRPRTLHGTGRPERRKAATPKGRAPNDAAS